MYVKRRVFKTTLITSVNSSQIFLYTLSSLPSGSSNVTVLIITFMFSKDLKGYGVTSAGNVFLKKIILPLTNSLELAGFLNVLNLFLDVLLIFQKFEREHEDSDYSLTLVGEGRVKHDVTEKTIIIYSRYSSGFNTSSRPGRSTSTRRPSSYSAVQYRIQYILQVR